jgi:phage/plasmid-like protein (TIGR03299 family)
MSEIDIARGVGIAPWEGVSQTPDPGREYADGQELADALGIGWRVELRPALYAAADGQSRAARGWQCAVRQTDGAALGMVGGRFHVVQNGQALDPVARLGVPVIAGGALGRSGEKVWCLTDLGTVEIPGRTLRDGSPDAIGRYLLFVNHHDGKGAVKLALVPFAFACANAINVAMSRATDRLAIRHTRSAERRLQEAASAIQIARAEYDAWFRTMAELDKERMDREQMRAFAEELIAEARARIDESKEVTERTERARIREVEVLTGLFDEGASNIGRSKLDALHAVTEYVDHHRRRAKKGGDQTRAQLSRLNDIWMGTPARTMKRRAMALLTRR